MRSAERVSTFVGIGIGASVRMPAGPGGGMKTNPENCRLSRSVRIAAKNSECADGMRKNIALMRVILLHALSQVTKMTDTAKIIAYQSAMAQARRMLSQSLITPAELALIEKKLAEKHSLNYGNIYRDMDLLSLDCRGNMSYCKGGASYAEKH